MDRDTTEACWSNHLGLWCVDALWFTQAVSAFKLGLYTVKALDTDRLEAAERDKRPYQIMGETAILPLQGPMSKGGSMKFGGASTVRLQRALRMAARDDEVQSILLDIDSPGGHVAGTEELANEVYRTRQLKPIGAHISDLGASAALWVGSQADFVTANSTAEVGSIGTVLALEDSSKRMERLGIDVHVLSTGPFKGIGVDGAPLSPEALSYLKSRVEGINQHFLAAIQRGRGLNSTQLGLVNDGRVHLAATAQQLGLIDAVQSFDTTLDMLRQAGVPQRFRATQAVLTTPPESSTAGNGPEVLSVVAPRRASVAQLQRQSLALRQQLRSIARHA